MSAGRTVNSLSQDWCTPPKYVEAIREMFDGTIELDPCSNISSIVHAKVEYILPKDDGLLKEWNFGKIYINPPYGADRQRGTTIKHWFRKCAETHSKHDAEILALVPVATNTSHWKHFVFGKASSVLPVPAKSITVILYIMPKLLNSGQSGQSLNNFHSFYIFPIIIIPEKF